MGDFSELAQTEDLISTAIRQNRFVPIHKCMQTAHRPHHFHPRPQIQMIRIPKNDLRTKFDQFTLLHRFHRPLRSDRHKDRSFDHTMIGFQDTCAG